jgi:alpha-L-rhamnosidase
LQYQAYDVANLITNGDNAIGAIIGNGWYRGYLAWGDTKNIYGKKLGLLAQINITYTDGSTGVIKTDENWKTTVSPIQSAEIYHGEMYDARAEQKGWSSAGFNDDSWTKVVTGNYPLNNLIATENEPVKSMKLLKQVN